MKILKINSSGFEEGGIENGLMLLQTVFENRGHQIKILASDTRPDLRHFNDYSFQNIDTVGIRKYLFYAFNPYSFFALRKILRDFAPDVVELHSMGQVSPSVLFLLKNYPTIMMVHGPEVFTKALLPWYLPTSDYKNGVGYDLKNLRLIGKLRYFYLRHITEPLYKIGFCNVDVVITLSGYMQRLMAREGLESIYIPNATTLLEYRPLEKKTITDTLIYAGRLEKFKGVSYLLSALPAVIAQFPDTKLLIAGDGSDRSHLEALIKELGIERNIEFLGQLNRSELTVLYQKASIMIVPSTWPEAFGKVGIEVMSVGRPVIASDVGGISDWLVDGKTGFLVKPKDSKAIADSILKLLSNRDLLIKMGFEARKKSEEFGIETHANQLEKIYVDIAKSKT